MTQTQIPEIENDVIHTEHSLIRCKIINVTDSVIIYKYNGSKQGIPIRKVEYFRYGRN